MTSLIDKLLNGIDAAGAPGVIAVAAGDERLRVELIDGDTLAVSFTELRCETRRLAGADAARVRGVADRITLRVKYLLEPLAPVEFDDEQAVVQLRSVDPPRDAQGPTYYEVLVTTGGAVTLRRYHKAPGAPRSVVPATVTREVLRKLVDDIVASVGA
ncbi:MAG: hypothetical protein ACRCT8_15860 [Lacipirellulaceae bacterium]